MKARIFLFVAVLWILNGCSTTNSGFSKPDLTKVTVGMTKEQVVKAMGKPDNISVQGPVEYLEYGWDKAYDGVVGVSEWFYVRMVRGAVESYGRKGDFDSTKNAAVDINVKQQIDSKTRVEGGSTTGDLFTELKKLQQLKDDGLITADEYEKLRKAAVEKAK